MFGIVGWIATARTDSEFENTNFQVAPPSVDLSNPSPPA